MTADKNQDLKAVLDPLLLGIPGVRAGKMFGHDAYFLHGKMFACIYGAAVGVKLPQETANQLLCDESIIPFQPHGKPKMKEWIQINRATPEDYRDDFDLFCRSVEFVSGLSRKDEKK